MEIHMEMIGDVAVVTLPSDTLGASNAKQFFELVTPIIERSNRVVFDLKNLEFVDSSGVGALLSCYRTVTHRQGRVALANASAPVAMLLDVVRMSRLVEIFPSTEEAVAALRPKEEDEKS